MEIFDLSDPAQPVFVSRIKFPSFYEMGNDMWGVTVVDGLAFVADTHNGMFYFCPSHLLEVLVKNLLQQLTFHLF